MEAGDKPWHLHGWGCHWSKRQWRKLKSFKTLQEAESALETVFEDYPKVDGANIRYESWVTFRPGFVPDRARAG